MPLCCAQARKPGDNRTRNKHDMKYLTLATAFLLLAGYSEAQFLKKLKEKTEKVIENKATGSGNSNTGQPEAKPAATETPASQGAKPSGDCKPVFTLEKDERFLYDETSISGYHNELRYAFVIQNKKYEYFLVENGARTGPFKEAPMASLSRTMEASTDNPDDEISMGNERKDPVALQYSKTINGKLFIVFNGKNYGPYDYVSKMLVSPDKKKFFAVVVNGGQTPMMAQMGMGNVYLVNEGSLNLRAGEGGMSLPLRFTINNSFTHCMATVMDQQSQQVLTISSAGKKESGNMADLYAGNSPRPILNDKGDIISIPAQSPTQLMVNGQEAANFKVPIRNRNLLYLTSDLSKSLYYENGVIYRGNGTEESLKDVLFPRFLTLNNETAVYYFNVYTNESGAKEVYLCKKVL